MARIRNDNEILGCFTLKEQSGTLGKYTLMGEDARPFKIVYLQAVEYVRYDYAGADPVCVGIKYKMNYIKKKFFFKKTYLGRY